MKKDSKTCCGLRLGLRVVLVFAYLTACRPMPTVPPTLTATPTPTVETKQPAPTAEPTPTVEIATPTIEPTPTLEGEVGLPFETIEKVDISRTGQLYEGKQPYLAIATEASQIASLGNMIPVDVQTQLRNLEQDRHFAVVVFLGWQPYVHPGIEIQRIGRKGKAITVYAHVLELVGEVRKLTVTSPYHIVSVQKGGDIQGEFEFIFNVDGVIVSRQTYHLP